MPPDRESKIDRLHAFQVEFQNQLDERLRNLQRAWVEALLSEDPKTWSPESSLRRQAHSLAGAGGSFGYKRLGERAHQFETDLIAARFHPVLSLEDRATFEAHLAELWRLASQGPGEDMAQEEALPEVSTSQSPSLIYVLEDDLLLAKELARQLNQFGYEVKSFSGSDELSKAIQNKMPTALLADISLPEGDLAGPDIVNELMENLPGKCPVVFISVHDHWQAHLAAVRAGGKAYFPKPLDFTSLVGQLDRITDRFPDPPFRILVVEDDEILARHYASVLVEAGMQAEIVNIPAELPLRLSSFSPDLILLDIFLPDCTGIEAATIIRQNPKYTHLPIVYLSKMDSREDQLSALQAGGDEFLQKPISDSHLVQAVRSRARRFQALNAMMSRDGLTGLLNHINLKLTLERELSQTLRRNGILTLAMIDVDHFKSVNDRYGHPTGDKVLKSLSRLLTERLRKGDFAARYGGEEFAVVMPDTDPLAAQKVLDGLRTQFATMPHLSDAGEFTATFSAGVASTPPHTKMDALLQAADQALYSAKHGGRNRVELEVFRK